MNENAHTALINDRAYFFDQMEAEKKRWKIIQMF